MMIAGCLAVTILLNNVVASGGLVCHGGDSLDPFKTLGCKTDSRLVEETKSQSCVRALLARDSSYQCSSTSTCLEVNIKLEAGSFEDTDNIVWSFLSCYSRNMDIRICADDVTTTTTTTTVATTTLTTQTTEIDVPSSTESEDMIRTSTTEDYSTTDDFMANETSQALTNTSTSTKPATTSTPVASTTTRLKSIGGKLKGCLVGSIQFEEACSLGSHDITLYDGAAGFSAKLTVVNCCSDANLCESSTSMPPDLIACQYGENNQLVETYCDTCWAYFLQTANQDNSWYGCIADLPLTDSSFYGVNSCLESYKSGACADAGNEKECLRCCETPNCNSDFNQIIDVFKAPATGQAAAAIPHLFLILLTLFVLEHL